jgi:hypothetical protein
MGPNMEENNALVNGNGPYNVMLPCEPKDFRDFIAGLLGKPQEARGKVDGIFTLRARDIANIFHLIHQRVSNQNSSTLIHFAIGVHYSDGNSVTHNSVEAFNSFHPVTPCFPVVITLSFTYLIKFNGREFPEKQEIDVVVNTDRDWRGEEFGEYWFYSGLFSYRIKHTEISWATDIGGLLKNHAETLIDKTSKLRLFFARHADQLFTYWLILVFVGVMVGWGYSAESIFQRDGINTVGEASRYLAISLSIFLSLIAILKILDDIFAYNVSFQPPSVIVLTAKDEERAARIHRSYLKTCFFVGGGWLFGLASGVFSNYLYAALTN